MTDIVHGDIKPDNVLIFADELGKYKARVTDFGYSSRYSNDNDHLTLPISLPWNAPEVDRPNREWTPSEAKQADLYSFGMLCLWLLFENCFSGEIKAPGSVNLPVATYASSIEVAKSVLLRVKTELQIYARQLLATEKSIDRQSMAALETFLLSCLSKDPSQREVPIQEFLEQLSPQR